MLRATLALGLVLGSLHWAAQAAAQCQASEHDQLVTGELPPYDAFGLAVSVDVATAVIGDVADADNGVNSGAAYVYRFNGSAWVQEQKLLAADGSASDVFGGSVAISGDVILIGARNDDALGNNSGSAYVFRFNGREWVQEQKLLANDGDFSDYFGISVAVSGDAAVVGAYFKTYVPGVVAGAAYVFRYHGSAWTQVQKLTPDDPQVPAQFGISAAISGGTAVIGAYFDDDMGDFSGSAYVFRFDGLSWVFEQKLLAADGGPLDQFGLPVAISGNTVVAGAQEHDHLGPLSGSAYVYRFDGSAWFQEQELLDPDGVPFDGFGRALDVDGNTAVVGAWMDDNENGKEAGSALVYRFDGKQWIAEARLTSTDTPDDEQFGESVAIGGDTALVGQSGFTTCSVCVFRGLSDCNRNGPLDLCDIANGMSADSNGNGVPDECECPWDLDGDGIVGVVDFLAQLAAWGPNPGHPADLDGDGTVGVLDFLLLLAHWGACP